MGTLIHFDISADDVERAKGFYEQLFGWKIEKVPAGPIEYYLITTHTATGEQGISGGIAKREKAHQKITNFIQVNAIDESMIRIRELGGEIIEPKAVIPGIGWIAGCKDTEGNIFGIMELKSNTT